jgi:hypothetical protein
MPNLKNYTCVLGKVETNFRKKINGKYQGKYLRVLLKRSLFFLLFFLCITNETAVACDPKDNAPLNKWMSVLKQGVSKHSAHELSEDLSNGLDMDLFLQNSVPSEILLSVNNEDKKQLKYFLKHAVSHSLEQYLTNPNLGQFYFQPIICQDANDQFILTVRYENGIRPIPLTLSFYHSNAWVMNDMAIDTTFLSKAFLFQFQNWALRESSKQIMISIRNHNAILTNNITSAS